jgi:hypothetical protein
VAEPRRAAHVPSAGVTTDEGAVRYFILWLLGVPISVVVLLWAFSIV